MSKNEKILKEKCFLLDWKTAVQSELIDHNRAIYRIRKKATLCKDSIRDIDNKLRKLETEKTSS